MNVIRCAQGHFYDSDQFTACPYCQPSMAQGNGTTSFAPSANAQKTISIQDFEKTTSFFQEKAGLEPVVGWLVCTAGEHYGKDFRLKTGRNFIGRASAMDIALEKEQSVSRERHAVIVYEPKLNIFLAQPGDSSALFYLNGNVVLTPTQVNKNDRLQIGNTELMLIPCCDASFEWSVDEKE